MTAKQGMLLGCGLMLLLGLAGVGAVMLLVFDAAQEVEGVEVTVDVPDDVVIGQTFELKVTATNKRPHGLFKLNDIDIGEDYLAGFSVVNTEPKYKSTMHVPFDNSKSFTFDAEIRAGESRTFKFKMRAEKVGDYTGGVDVCEGNRFITESVMTTVGK